MTKDPLVTQIALSRKLNRSRVTIWRWIQNGTLPAPIKKLDGEVLGWEAEVIDDWLKGNRQ